MKNKVYLVGAGPGDPELITLKAARLLSQAEVVVYDFLVNIDLLKLVPQKAQRIYVGKKSDNHFIEQEEINALLCDLATQGYMVVRLKGGDPFVFGRGSEEACALFARGIDFEIVPGITSAIAAPAYAGIPVTDRRYTTEVAFITGHESLNKNVSNIKWTSLVDLGTIVFLMGIKNLSNICNQLISHGKSPHTPAAVIHWGSTPNQQTVVGNLVTLPNLVYKSNIKSPAIIIIGQVVELRNQLRWFEQLPLFGRRILVTRAYEQANKLSEGLKRLGAEVLEIPTIALKAPHDNISLLSAASRIENYDWLLFTSVNGVKAFITALETIGKDVRVLSSVSLGAIGLITAQALQDKGLLPELVATTYTSEGLIKALADYNLAGAKILIPRAQKARRLLPETLRNRGAKVEVIPAYRIISPPESALQLKIALKQGLEAIIFTASSTVTNLMKLLDKIDKQRLREATASGVITIAAIGPVTGQTVRQAGLVVHVQPDIYTIEALIKKLVQYFQIKT